MGVRIISNSADDLAALYCSTSDFAFGPVFYADDDATASERAEDFCDWFMSGGARIAASRLGLVPILRFGGTDPREWMQGDLERLYGAWLAESEQVAS